MEQTNQKGGGKKTGMAVLAYIIFFLPLLTSSKDDPFVKYHAKQGLILFVAGIVIWLVKQAVPVLGMLLYPFLSLALFVLLIIGIINAVNGHEKPLPWIGKFASNINF